MKVSYEWLRAIAPGLDRDPEAVVETLAARGAPVEGVVRVAEGLDDIVVARVDAVRDHPNADRLRLCTVMVPGSEPLQVVCGAPNVEAGALYPFAPVGASLPDGMTIRKAKLRGEVSEGMLCSARELALGTDHAGIMRLPDGLEVGAPLVQAFGLDDWRLAVEVTANRGDLLSHLGVAREVAPGGPASLTLPDIPGSPKLDLDFVAGERESRASGVTVRIEDPARCLRYLGAVIRGVRVGPSSGWLQARLRAAGARPINNVVDATNYVLLELGQPLHAFDLGRLADETVVVRTPTASETSFRTLDGEERTLSAEMLLICDADEPVALAGVMGGLDSEVTAETTDVLLECALFDPANIRSTRRALDLSTDASYRFERGVDPAGMERAITRAAALIVATAGGRVERAVADCHPAPRVADTVELRIARVEKVLGVPFDGDRIRELLTPLGFGITGAEILTVTVPGWRSYDVTREVDLIEEIARTHGYDAFPEELAAFRPGTVPDHPLFRLEDDLRTLMVGEGFFEAQLPAFVPSSEGTVRVKNPVSKEEDHLRGDLLPPLLRRIEHNWGRGVRDVRLFEIGTAFRATREGERPYEETRLSAVVTGRSAPAHWSREPRVLDLWDVKGLLEIVQARVWPKAVLREKAPDGGVVEEGEGFTLVAGGETVGWAGRIRSEALDPAPWADPVYGLEVRLPPEPEPPSTPVHHPLPPYPGVERDLALLVPESVPAARVEEEIRSSGGEHLAGVTLFDRYVGGGVPEGTRSLAFRLRFQSFERTLTDEDVDRATADVVTHLRSEVDVEPRG